MLSTGIHFDVSATTYFADPAPQPSLTQSIAKVIIERSAWHAWHQHPRLNPAYAENDDTKFDVGNVAHKLLIGRGKDFAALPFDNWTTKAAKEAREAHRAAGRIGILAHQFDRAQAMTVAARRQLAVTEHADAFRLGHGEVVAICEDHGAHLRTMIDWMIDETSLYDFKSTDMSCAPHAVIERPSVMGWDVQGAFQEHVLDILKPASAGQRKFHFVAQETDPPYALTVLRLSDDDLLMGKKKIDFALPIWRSCVAANVWPSYSRETIVSRPRAYLEQQWLARETHAAAVERMPKRGPMLTSLAGG